jgi:hypothetical protein
MAGGIALQSAQTTGNGTVMNFRGQAGHYTFSVQPAGTITAGAVQFETAPSSDFSGTWQPVGAEIMVPQDGSLAQFTVEDRFYAVRARITTTVTGSGGSVTARVAPPLVPR